MTFIDTCLRQNGHRMFTTYRILDEAERSYDMRNPPYNNIKTKRKMIAEYQEANVEETIAVLLDDQQRIDLLRELQAARRIRKNARLKREEQRQLERREEANLLKAQAEGTMLDCQCCFGDYPINRMVHCGNEVAMHWFCRSCARQNAETVIGQSKFELVCMAMEGCTYSFSLAQR
jgi:TRIAD3 protein (E3 ubiquitin-protein ligase RNF216)